MISVRVMATQGSLEFRLDGRFEVDGKVRLPSGEYTARLAGERISLFSKDRGMIIQKPSLDLLPERPQENRFLLNKVPVGRGFHWEERQDLTFQGELHIRSSEKRELEVINRLPLEIYLSSVIGSEMSGEAPFEFLKAHAVISRSWALRRMRRKSRAASGHSSHKHLIDEDQIIRWTGAEIHQGFHVCADDHCQRYRGYLGETASSNSEQAVRETRGEVLTYGDEIGDTRYGKCCGGMTENFSTAWEDQDIPYLRAVPDHDHAPGGFCFPLSLEENAKAWIIGSPDAFCNTRDRELLQAVLSPLDRQTTDFYRWKIAYSQEEIRQIITEKTERDLGWIRDLSPIERGASGRIIRLRIVGTVQTLTVGKELEIRRILSPTHLYSSAFVIHKEGGEDGIPRTFRLIGAGWGHGVGLCQIGAAVMATRGKNYRGILQHYFPGTSLTKH